MSLTKRNETVKRRDKDRIKEFIFKDGFLIVPNSILRSRISSGAKLVFSMLLSLGNELKAWPKQNFLIKSLGLSERSLRRYLRELEELGLVKIGQRGRKGNLYILKPAKLADLRGLTGQNGRYKPAKLADYKVFEVPF